MDSERKDAEMGTGDMHGGTVEFKDREGNPVNFEMVRVGTTKELATVTKAVASLRVVLDTCEQQKHDFHARLTDANAMVATVKEDNATFRDAVSELNDDLASARSELEATHAANAANQSEILKLNGILKAADVLNSEACDASTKLRAELEDLMTVKASLEETNTALEVKDKELCEAREALADATKANAGYRDANSALTHDCDVSKFALAALKAELLKDAGCMSDILDAMHAKVTGE